MIRYLRHHEIDKELWDKKITASPHGLVYAFSWFLDIVAPGWDALVEEDYDSVFPLTQRKKGGFNYLFQPYFTQQLGLFSSNEKPESREVSRFIQAIPAQFRLIEIQLNTANDLVSPEGFKIFPRKTHHLSLLENFDDIRKKFSENLRRNIRKSESSAIQIAGCSTSEIIGLFRNNRGSSIGNLNDSAYRTFSNLVMEAEKRNRIERIGCRNESGELIAGTLFIKSVHSWIFIFSATNEEGRNTGAMSRVINTFIQRHSGESLYLDFEGSMDENLSRFYKSFGSREVVYLQIRKNNLPLLIRWLK